MQGARKDRILAASFRDRTIFHITHIRNLPGILTHGELVCDSEASRKNLIEIDIGMPSIKARRRTTVVPCGQGGTPADYVPFYFGPRSPMLFSISRGNVQTYSEGQDPVIYLVTTLATVRSAGLPCVFTEGNAGAGFVEFHDDDAQLLESSIDWALMRARYWTDTADDPARANRRQAEYLVHRAMPTSLLRMIAARTEARAGEVMAIMAGAGSAVPVSVRPDWYY